MTGSVSVMVVEDSAVARELIAGAVAVDKRLRLLGAVETAESALRLVPRLLPDVISMDIRLPGMDGIEATRRIMSACPTPIVIVAADLRSDTVSRTMQALYAGALTVVEKPAVESADAYGAMTRRLCDQFVNMSRVKVVRRRFDRAGGHRVEARDAALRCLEPVGRVDANGAIAAIGAIGIVASTGGPAAVARLLRALPAEFPTPILLVQHMGAQFLTGYAAWLQTMCGLKVALAGDGERLQAGRVYVAPGDRHLTLRGDCIRLLRPQSAHGHAPSGDALFESLAANFGGRAVGVLLTGMGDDGARGLLAMRKAGAHTIGQDLATSTVYGMPAAAKRLGAVAEELAIGAVALRLVHLVAGPAGALWQSPA